MKPNACPDLDTLEKLLLGDLPAPKRESLDEHLEQCERCTATAATISASDELTEAIRTRRDFSGDEEILAKVIERGKQLRNEVETSQSHETLAVDMRKHRQGAAVATPASADCDDRADHEPIDFLHPAEQPDEIGRLGGYRVLEVLGVGGMGVVFRAEDPKLERLVALKAMKPAVAASASAKQRFLREAKATASIEHENIVSIYQVGEDRNIPFIAMPFLRGESLQSRLDREGKLAQHEVVRIGCQIASGLAAAHKRDLIHRDIKPDNIWLEEETGRAKILDFGLVRSIGGDDGLTQSGLVVGTPRYMAPEQAQGKSVDHRSDLFSLGSVLYHLATGKQPFPGKDVTAVLLAVSHQEPEPIENQLSCPADALADLITRLLSKDVAQRPQSAEEVERILADIEAASAIIDANATELTGPWIPSVETVSPQTRKLQDSRCTLPRKAQPFVLVGSVLATIAIGGVIALWAAGVLQVRSKHGTLVVNVTDDDFTTSVQGKKVTIQNLGTKDEYTIDLTRPEQMKQLAPGEYKFLLTTASGLQTRTDRFSIAAGESQKVEVWWQPKQTKVAQGDKQPVASLDSQQRVPAESVRIRATTPQLDCQFEHEAQNFYDGKFARISPDASTVAFRMGEERMRMFERASGKELALPEEMIDASCLGYSGDGRIFATGHMDGIIRLWNAETLAPIGEPFKSPTSPHVHWVALSDDGSRLLAMASEREVKVKKLGTFFTWDTSTRKLISRFDAETNEMSIGSRIDASADGRLVVVSGQMATTLWDSSTGKQIPGSLELPEHLFYRLVLDLSEDGSRFAYGVMNGSASYVAVLDTKTGDEVWRSPFQQGRVYAVKFSHDGRLLASTSAVTDSSQLHLWNASTGVEVIRWKQEFEDKRKRSESVKFLSFTNDGLHLLSAGFGVPVRVWRLQEK